jgi:hypothetical protein
VFDAPIDALYTWLGVSFVAAGALAVAVGVPATPPPDAAAVAETVDGLAASPYAGAATVSLGNADELRLTPRGVSLRAASGTVSATFEHGPVVIVTGASDALAAVLHGTDPREVFEDQDALVAATRGTADGQASWRTAPERLRVRHITWGGVDVTLVG